METETVVEAEMLMTMADGAAFSAGFWAALSFETNQIQT
jgi:hypothetical protein